MRKTEQLVPFKPFKGITTIIHVSKEGMKFSFNSLPDEYMPEVEKLIQKCNRKFGRRVRALLPKGEDRECD